MTMAKEAYGQHRAFPKIKLEGQLDATFPYIISHLQYIISELLRNSIQAVVERGLDSGSIIPPIAVLICETPQHVIFRISDQGGGISEDTMSRLWSFSKGTRSQIHLQNLSQVPKMAATMQELKLSTHQKPRMVGINSNKKSSYGGSLGTLTSRPPNLRLGMGLPMSRIYAEYAFLFIESSAWLMMFPRYWAGSLELHSLEGYGVDVFLQISKLGNKNEQLSTRASIDSV